MSMIMMIMNTMTKKLTLTALPVRPGMTIVATVGVDWDDDAARMLISGDHDANEDGDDDGL